MIHGYGINCSGADLREAGAERVWIETDTRRRPVRTDLFQNQLRSGDDLILISARALGGSPIADEQWRQRCETLGINLVVKEKPARPAHRPRQYEPNARDSDIWLNDLYTEALRLEMIEQANGQRVSKGVLARHYGTLKNPTPFDGFQGME